MTVSDWESTTFFYWAVPMRFFRNYEEISFFFVVYSHHNQRHFTMKKSIIGSLIGIGIVVIIDLLSRVVIALYMKEDILMFSYSNYPGLLWPALLTVIGGFSSLFGGMFALTYGRINRVFSVILFTALILLLRYSQIHILYETETILFPLLTFTLSLIAVFLAWKFSHKPMEKGSEFKTEEIKSDSSLRSEVNRPH